MDHVKDKIIDKIIDLIINIVGVMIGGLLAYILAKWQMKKQNENKEDEEKRILKLKLQRCFIEFEYNQKMIEQLWNTMRDTGVYPKDEQWEYYLSINNSLSFLHYEDLVRTGLNNKLPEDIDNKIFDIYSKTIDIYNLTTQSYRETKSLKSNPNPNKNIEKPALDLVNYISRSNEIRIMNMKAIKDYIGTHS